MSSSRMSNHELSHIINEQIIDHILNSPLNISTIPDDIEREMYHKILYIIEENLTSANTQAQLSSCCFVFMNYIKDCFKRKKN